MIAVRELTEQGRELVQRRLGQLFAERNQRLREINSEYESERKRLEKMLQTGLVPQTIG